MRFLLLSISINILLNLLPCPAHGQVREGLTWPNAKNKKTGEIIIYWYESRPFIYRDDHRLIGIEYEIMNGFIRYLNAKYNLQLTCRFIEASGFSDCYNRIAGLPQEGTFGASAFSITTERKSKVNFSPAYLQDIVVLISSKNVPIVANEVEFKTVFSKLTAITIEGTTYEKDLLKLKKDQNLPFPIKYINSSQNILHEIEKNNNAFGFIDLPVYLMMFNENSSINVERQNLFPIRREGYGIIYPLQSSWSEPINDYFTSDQFKTDLKKYTPNYLTSEIYQFLENLSIQSNDPVILLNKEKDIQYRDLLLKSQRITDETKLRNIMIGLTIISIVLFLWVVSLYRKRKAQNEKIEAQAKNIESKSLQLEKRNEHLVALDEEKNNLIKILAHDLRTPINQVQGLAQLLLIGSDPISSDQKDILQKITNATQRLTKMITNILDIDGLENNRTKVFLEPVSISKLLDQVTKSFEKQAAAKRLELKFSPSKELSIVGDSLFLTQVFENLISNAIKFSPPGKSIEVFAEEQEGNAFRVIVQDHGQGLTPDDMKFLFKKFSRLSAQPTGGEPSTGLGLSIVKKYVEMMNGKVWCESELGITTRFIVTFLKN